MTNAASVAAGVILPSWLAIVLFLLGAIVTVGVVIAWLRHHGLDRRVDALERNRREDQERSQRLEQMMQSVISGQQSQNGDIKNVKEMLHTIVQGHMRNG
ncbi:hypothetical protein AD945_01850 [Gluconobacter albidus]|uniref:Uncharacterized protein n=1 Tax=Gluconobacter albidus TaxID=318683 RepID=A0A149TMS9_9PROT|nr:hypothetical protein [Gluconobacter albidus]KXV50548.1 hypothetical protein AD945_01850 [Gluconobacter albidus]